MKALDPSQTSVRLCACHLSNRLLLRMLLSLQLVPIGLWPCTADPADIAVVHEGRPGTDMGFSSLSRNGSVSLVKLGSEGQTPGPPEWSRMPAASSGPTGILVGGPSCGSLGLPHRERLQLATLVCLHSS